MTDLGDYMDSFQGFETLPFLITLIDCFSPLNQSDKTLTLGFL
jgi:hypothetical protein